MVIANNNRNETITPGMVHWVHNEKINLLDCPKIATCPNTVNHFVIIHCVCSAGVPAKTFLVELLRPENFHRWKVSRKILASRSFPVSASDFFPERKHWARTS